MYKSNKWNTTTNKDFLGIILFIFEKYFKNAQTNNSKQNNFKGQTLYRYGTGTYFMLFPSNLSFISLSVSCKHLNSKELNSRSEKVWKA